MRCPDCCKFVSMEFGDPEVNTGPDFDVTVNEDGSCEVTITAEVRIVRTCAECGQDMKEATFEMEAIGEVSAEVAAPHVKDGDFKDGCEFTCNFEDPEQVEEGGGRYAKSYFGASIAWRVECACGASICDGAISDKVAASGMDECV